MRTCLNAMCMQNSGKKGAGQRLVQGEQVSVDAEHVWKGGSSQWLTVTQFVQRFDRPCSTNDTRGRGFEHAQTPNNSASFEI